MEKIKNSGFLSKTSLLKGVLTESPFNKNPIIKVPNPHGREKEINKTNSIQKKKNKKKELSKKILKKVKSRITDLKNKSLEEIKDIKKINSKIKKNSSGAKVREIKNNYIDKGIYSQKKTLNNLYNFSKNITEKEFHDILNNCLLSIIKNKKIKNKVIICSYDIKNELFFIKIESYLHKYQIIKDEEIYKIIGHDKFNKLLSYLKKYAKTDPIYKNSLSIFFITIVNESGNIKKITETSMRGPNYKNFSEKKINMTFINSLKKFSDFIKVYNNIDLDKTPIPLTVKAWDELKKVLNLDNLKVYIKPLNKEIIIPVFFMDLNYFFKNKKDCDYYACIQVYRRIDKEQNIMFTLPNFFMEISPFILQEPLEAIKSTIAHEIEHFKRHYANKKSSEFYEKNNFYESWEEYMADRGIKRNLVLIDSEYNNRDKRLETLNTIHVLKDRSFVTGPLTPLGEWYDRLVAFSINEIKKRNDYIDLIISYLLLNYIIDYFNLKSSGELLIINDSNYFNIYDKRGNIHHNYTIFNQDLIDISKKDIYFADYMKWLKTSDYKLFYIKYNNNKITKLQIGLKGKPFILNNLPEGIKTLLKTHFNSKNNFSKLDKILNYSLEKKWLDVFYERT